MAVDFLTDAQAALYGRFGGVPSITDLEGFFFLDDADKAFIGTGVVITIDSALFCRHLRSVILGCF